MEHIINLINNNMPENVIKFTGFISTTPGHIAVSMALLSSIFLISYIFKHPIKNFVQYKLYKHRKKYVYKILFYRLKYIIKPFRYLISAMLLKKSISIFTVSEDMEFFFYVMYVFIVSWWVYEIIKFMLHISLSLKIKKQQEVRRELFNLFLNIIKILIGLIIVFVILSKMGVDLTGLITSLGVGGVVIGLSAKDTLTNFFDSIRLVGEDAFHIGDWIETKDVEGFVTEIGLAATRIRTFDNALVTIPNSKIASEYIKNWSKRMIGRRIKFHLKIKYTYDTVEIDRVLFEIREMLLENPDIVNDNKLKYLIKMKQTFENGLFDTKDILGVKSNLFVYLDEIDEYSMNILIYSYSITIKWEEWLIVKQNVLKKIIKIIDESNLELAIPKEEILLESNRE